jgi:molybdopterin-guanine dinucleotide biosynthesis protein A
MAANCMRSARDPAIVILAGGEARRFPGKLEHLIEGRPMFLRVYEAMRATQWPLYIAGKGTFSPPIDAQLEAPLVIDRLPGRGPLAALVNACALIRERHVFAIAADQPHLDASALRRLADSWRPGDEAVVPEHDGSIEPLAALYARPAILREGFELRGAKRKAMHAMIDRLAVRFVKFDSSHFRNVNRPGDLA